MGPRTRSTRSWTSRRRSREPTHACVACSSKPGQAPKAPWRGLSRSSDSKSRRGDRGCLRLPWTDHSFLSEQVRARAAPRRSVLRLSLGLSLGPNRRSVLMGASFSHFLSVTAPLAHTYTHTHTHALTRTHTHTCTYTNTTHTHTHTHISAPRQICRAHPPPPGACTSASGISDPA